MKRVLLICWGALMVGLVSAQDFISLYTADNSDSNLKQVTISPKMMEEIMRGNADGQQDIMNIISDLKSMRVVSSSVNGKNYYNNALKILEENRGRFDPYNSFSSNEENLRIAVRRNRGQIVEMVMLNQVRDGFMAVSLTGDIKPEFISSLAKSLASKKEF